MSRKRVTCPFCAGEFSRVIDTNPPLRRRQCLNPECEARWTTEERNRPLWLHRDLKHRPKQPTFLR